MNKLFFRKPFKYTFFNATLYLILINFAVFLLTNIMPRLNPLIGLNTAYFLRYRLYWQIFTYMFVHNDLSHILFNMLALAFFGMPVEQTVGSKEFLLFYLISGIMSGFISFLVYSNYRIFTLLIGASGAIYAVLFMYAVIFPRSKIYIWGLIPVPAPLLVIIYAIIETGSHLTYTLSHVAHFTHLAGFFIAWLYLVIRMGIHPLKVWKNAYCCR